MAMEAAGHECVGFCEIDKYAVQSYRAIYDAEGEFYAEDITRIDPDKLPDFDCITGGFPCQSFSVAGKRGGFDDTRGTLFFDIARIIEARKPRLLLLENVKGLLNHDRGRTFRVILTTLDELGYDLQWQVLNSKDFGVPQNRERVFIVGHLRGGRGRAIFPIGGTNQKACDEGTTQIKRIGEIASNREDGLSHVSDRIYCPSGIAPSILSREHKGGAMVKIGNVYPSGGQAGKIYSDEGISTTVSGQRVNSQGFVAIPQREGTDSGSTPIGHLIPDHQHNQVYDIDKIAPALTYKTDGRVHIIPEQFSEGDGLAHALEANYHKGLGPSQIGRGRRTHVVSYDRKEGIGKEFEVAYTLNESDWRGLNRNQPQTAVVETIKQVGRIGDANRENPNRYRVYDTEGIAPTLGALSGGGLHPHIVDENTQQETARPVALQNANMQGRRIKDDGDPAFTVSATDRHGVMIGASRGRNPENPSDRSRGIYVEQTFEPAPDGLANTISTVQKDNLLAIRETEDGFHLARNDEKKSSVQGTHVTYPEGKSHCLSTNHVPMTMENIRIRRLTPRECWRLQGFPDWAFDRAKESGVSDTQLYRQAGNSVTVNVVYEIAKRFGD